MRTGPFPQYRKIDFFCMGQYICSSTAYPNLQAAVKGFREDPTFMGLRPDGTIGLCQYTGWSEVSVWWSERK